MRPPNEPTRTARRALPKNCGVPHQSIPPEATLDWQPSRLAMSIHPDEGIVLCFQDKQSGIKVRLRLVEMKFNYQDTFATRPLDAYETLLRNVMKNDAALFMRAEKNIDELLDNLNGIFHRLRGVASTRNCSTSSPASKR